MAPPSARWWMAITGIPQAFAGWASLSSRQAPTQDQRPRGRVADYRTKLTFDNGTVVDDGDIIVADLDGVLVVLAVHATDIIAAALVKVGAERGIQKAIAAGETTSSVFARTGIM